MGRGYSTYGSIFQSKVVLVVLLLRGKGFFFFSGSSRRISSGLSQVRSVDFVLLEFVFEYTCMYADSCQGFRKP